MNQTVSDYRFKFSVVTAVYNVEPYLAEAIESILAQDIGFEESVEMVLVDDGSTDGSVMNISRNFQTILKYYTKKTVALHVPAIPESAIAKDSISVLWTLMTD